MNPCLCQTSYQCSQIAENDSAHESFRAIYFTGLGPWNSHFSTQFVFYWGSGEMSQAAVRLYVMATTAHILVNANMALLD
jgi:hypothetical protein